MSGEARISRMTSMVLAKPWQDSISSCQEGLSFLLSSGMHSDVMLVVGPEGKRFKVHRLILSTRSPVFEDLLLSKGLPTTSDVISLKEESVEAVQWILQHIYCDKTDLESVDFTLRVLRLADKYMVASAYDACVKFLQGMMKRSNVLKIFQYFVELFPDNDSLFEICRKFFEDNGNAVLMSPSLQELTIEAIDRLLQEPLRVTSEVVIFKAILSWGTAQLKIKGIAPTALNLRAEVDRFLKRIRFLTMSTEDFVQTVVVSDVLNPEESVYLLKSIAKNDDDEDRMRTIVCSSDNKKWLTDGAFEFQISFSDNIVLLALKLQLEGGTQKALISIFKDQSGGVPISSCESTGNSVSFNTPVHVRESTRYVVQIKLTDSCTFLFGAANTPLSLSCDSFHVFITPGVYVHALVFV